MRILTDCLIAIEKACENRVLEATNNIAWLTAVINNIAWLSLWAVVSMLSDLEKLILLPLLLNKKKNRTSRFNDISYTIQRRQASNNQRKQIQKIKHKKHGQNP